MYNYQEHKKHTHMHTDTIHIHINSHFVSWSVVIPEPCMKEVSPTSGTIDSGLSAGLFVAGLASGIVITLLVVGVIWGACKLSQRK